MFLVITLSLIMNVFCFCLISLSFMSCFRPLVHFSKSLVELRFDFFSLPTSHSSLELGLEQIYFRNVVQVRFSQICFFPSSLLPHCSKPPSPKASGQQNSRQNLLRACLYIPSHLQSPPTGQLPSVPQYTAHTRSQQYSAQTLPGFLCQR